MKKIYMILGLCFLVALVLCFIGYYSGYSFSSNAKNLIAIKASKPQALTIQQSLAKSSSKIDVLRKGKDIIEGMKYPEGTDLVLTVSNTLKKMGCQVKDVSIKTVEPDFYLFRRGVSKIMFDVNINYNQLSSFLATLANLDKIWFFSTLSILPDPNFIKEISLVLGDNVSTSLFDNLGQKVSGNFLISITGEFYCLLNEV